MALYGNTLTVPYVAWDTDANAPALNDAANHTMRLIRDGVAAAPTNDPVDVENGACALTLTAVEMQAGTVMVEGTSITPNVIILPLTIITERGPGTNTVTVTVTDGTTVYEGVRVTVNNQTETGLPEMLLTDENGQAVFYRANGDWRAIAADNGSQGGGATNFTVDGPESVTITVTAAAPPTPAPAGYCNVYCYAETQKGAAGTQGTFSVDHLWSPSERDAGAMTIAVIKGSDRKALGAVDPDDDEAMPAGTAKLTVWQGAVVTFRLETVGNADIRRKITVPDTSKAYLWDIAETA